MSKPKKQIFKRKFSVPGNTVQTCKHFPCHKLEWDKMPCILFVTKDNITQLKNRGIHYHYYIGQYIKLNSNCPYIDKLNKPKDYIVAEKMDGTVVCDCASGKFRRDENGNTTCAHRDTAYSNPEKYEIPADCTSKDVSVINAL